MLAIHATMPCSLRQNNRGKKGVIGVNSERRGFFRCPVSTHAEMDALSKLESTSDRSDRIRYDLLVVRISPTGILGNSRPCYHCLRSLGRTFINIRSVYYSTIDGRIVREKFSEMIDSPLTGKSTGYCKKLWNPSSLKSTHDAEHAESKISNYKTNTKHAQASRKSRIYGSGSTTSTTGSDTSSSVSSSGSIVSDMSYLDD
jgi:hypothetical protein